MKINMKQVAAECGVNVSTVSRALHGDPRVKLETRERIVAAAKRLGYQPNLAARSLVKGRARVIWCLMPSLSNLCERQPAEFASRWFSERGYDLLVAVYECDEARYLRMLNRLSQGVADGAIVIPNLPADPGGVCAGLVAKGVPLVFLDRRVEGVEAESFTTANRAAARRLADWCFEQGARRLVVTIDTRDHVASSRSVGALERAAAGGTQVLLGENELNKLQPGEPLGVVANSQYAFLDLARRHAEALAGREVYAAVFDKWLGGAAPATRALSCIQNFDLMAERACASLLELLDRRRQNSLRVTEIPPLRFEEHGVP